MVSEVLSLCLEEHGPWRALVAASGLIRDSAAIVIGSMVIAGSAGVLSVRRASRPRRARFDRALDLADRRAGGPRLRHRAGLISAAGARLTSWRKKAMKRAMRSSPGVETISSTSPVVWYMGGPCMVVNTGSPARV